MNYQKQQSKKKLPSMRPAMHLSRMAGITAGRAIGNCRMDENISIGQLSFPVIYFSLTSGDIFPRETGFSTGRIP